MWKHLVLSALLGTALPLNAHAAEISSSVEVGTLPQHMRTPLGLYLTPADAHRALQADPGIVFIDVRDPIEINFVGHPDGMDANVPVAIATHRFDPKAGRYAMVPNARFLEEVSEVVQREGGDRNSPIFVICRSGARSAAAARQLMAAGFTNVWNVVEGFEGDGKPTSGTRNVNGWRNAGLPWSYRIPAASGWQGDRR